MFPGYREVVEKKSTMLPCQNLNMKRFLKQIPVSLTLMLLSTLLKAQELFVFTEPASNMPSKSLGIRASNWLMYDKSDAMLNYQLIPELMWGVNKDLMLHFDGFFTNQGGNFHGV